MTIPFGTNTNLSGPGYSPATITVVMGVNNTVMWKNNDGATHTATSDGGTFDSGDIKPNQAYTLTFNNTGTYTYHCTYHAFMHGTVIVKAASAVPEFPVGWLAAILLVSMAAAAGATRLTRRTSAL